MINLEYEKIYQITVFIKKTEQILSGIELDENASMNVEKILKIKNQYF